MKTFKETELSIDSSTICWFDNIQKSSVHSSINDKITKSTTISSRGSREISCEITEGATCGLI